MSKHSESTSFTTFQPGAVFGPALLKDKLGSLRIVRGLLHGRPARIPRIGFHVVDVRDVAALHVRAVFAPEAAGQRFLAASEFRWFEDVADALHAGLGERASGVPTRTLPDFAVRLLAVFAPPPAVETVVECGKSLLT